MPLLTLGIPVYDDTDSVIMAIQSFRMQHEALLPEIELVVGNNNPNSHLGKRLGVFLNSISPNRGTGSNRLPDGIGTFARVRHIRMESPIGTAVAKNAVIEASTTPWTLVDDSHVLHPAGSILDVLTAIHEGQLDPHNLYTGLLMFTDLNEYRTHFSDVWGGNMKGQWQVMHEKMDGHYVPEQGVNPLVPAGRSSEPFEVPAMGMGCFLVSRKHWLGYNSQFRGFGGEEWYIHEKYRLHGYKGICLPYLRWWHLFRDGKTQTPYMNVKARTVQNLVVGYLELGKPLDELEGYFLRGAGKMPEEQWKQIVNDPYNQDLFPVRHRQDVEQTQTPVSAPSKAAAKTEEKKGGCTQCEINGRIKSEKWTINDLYRYVSENETDLKTHLPVLRELAKECKVIVEHCNQFGLSTSAFAAGMQEVAGTGRRIHHRTIKHAVMLKEFEKKLSNITVFHQIGLPLEHEQTECDLLFLDTIHTADHILAELERYASKVKKYIVIHDTETYGERGEGGAPGLIPGIVKWLSTNTDWLVIRQYKESHGLIVLSRLDEYREDKPSLLSSAYHYMTSKAVSLTRTLKGEENELPDVLYQARLKHCMLCPSRHRDECSLCGCPVDKKAADPSQHCELAPPKWGPVSHEQLVELKKQGVQ